MLIKRCIALFACIALFGALSVRAAPTPAAPAGLEKATFAAGCFWCAEAAFEGMKGVSSVVSGYTGGTTADPTYEQSNDGTTGHAEAIEIIFDPKVVSYAELLQVFWSNTDPTVKDQQFCDKGNQYRSAIFTHTPEQAKLAADSKAAWAKDARFAGKTIHTEVNVAGPFYLAEDYHQDYASRNSAKYKYYRWGCGRDKRLKQIWGAAPAAH
jgi:peptide-methionine (S)-S-oxide reductase